MQAIVCVAEKRSNRCLQVVAAVCDNLAKLLF